MFFSNVLVTTLQSSEKKKKKKKRIISWRDLYLPVYEQHERNHSEQGHIT